MSFKEEIKDDIVVLKVKGNMMGGSDTTDIHEHVKQSVEKGNTKFVIDIGQVKWLNSSGIGVLMACYTSINSKGGSLVLTRVTKKVQSLLVMTKILTFFKTAESIDEGIALL